MNPELYNISEENLTQYIQHYNATCDLLRELIANPKSKTKWQELDNLIPDKLDSPYFHKKDKDEIHQYNKQNLHKIIQIIRYAGYTEQWENSFLYQQEFLAIAHTPIYLPIVFPDVISGEFLLFLLHGSTISPRPYEQPVNRRDNTEDPTLDPTANYRRNYQRKLVIEQIARELNLSLAELGWAKGTALWELANLYSYVEYTSQGDGAVKQAKKHGSKPLFHIWNEPSLNLSRIFLIPQMDASTKKQVLFKTFLLQRLSDWQRLDLHSYEILFKLTTATITSYLDYQLWPWALTLRNDISELSIYDLLSNLQPIIDRYIQSLSDNKVPVRSDTTENNLWHHILWRTLAKEHLAYHKTADIVNNLMTPWGPIFSHQQANAYNRLISFQDLAGNDALLQKTKHSTKKRKPLDTPETFFNKNKDDLCQIFPALSKSEIKKLWLTSMKAHLYWHPEQFKFSEPARLEAPKTISPSWIKDAGIDILSLQFRDLIPMMFLIHGAKKVPYGKWSMYQTLDNIRNHDSPLLFQMMSRHLEVHRQAGMACDSDFNWFRNLRNAIHQNAIRAIESASMEAEINYFWLTYMLYSNLQSQWNREVTLKVGQFVKNCIISNNYGNAPMPQHSFVFFRQSSSPIPQKR